MSPSFCIKRVTAEKIKFYRYKRQAKQQKYVYLMYRNEINFNNAVDDNGIPVQCL